jgi:hypothetical protein
LIAVEPPSGIGERREPLHAYPESQGRYPSIGLLWQLEGRATLGHATAVVHSLDVRDVVDPGNPSQDMAGFGQAVTPLFRYNPD